MKKPVLLILSLSIIVIILSVIRTFVANNLATSGVILQEIAGKISKLQTENSILAEKFYQQSALTNLSSKASQIGFVSGSTDFVLSSEQPVAFKQ